MKKLIRNNIILSNWDHFKFLIFSIKYLIKVKIILIQLHSIFHAFFIRIIFRITMRSIELIKIIITYLN